MDEEHDFFLSKEEYSQIIEKCEHMLASKTEIYFDVHEFTELVDFYIDDGKLNKAYTVVSIALKQHPHNSELDLKRAKIHIERNDADSALSILKNLYALEPDNSDVVFLMGMAYSIQEQFSKAVNFFNTFIEIEGDEELEEHYYTIAINFINNHQYKHALFFLKQAYAINNENSLVVYDLAFCYEKMGKYKKSIQLYAHYIEQDPYSENAWYNMGVIYSEIEDFDKAIEAFDFAIAIDESFSSAYFNKGNCFASLNLHNQAIEMYQEYLKLEPDSILGHVYIGESFDKTKDYEQAEAHYIQATEIDSDCVEAWFGLCMVSLNQSEILNAIKFVKKAIELNSTNEHYWLTYGILLKNQELYEEAIGSIKKAIEIDKAVPESWIELADIYYSNNLFEEATDTLRKGYEHNADNAPLLYTLAAYLTYTGDIELAKEYFIQAFTENQEESSIFFDVYNKEEQIITQFNHFIQKIL